MKIFKTIIFFTIFSNNICGWILARAEDVTAQGLASVELEVPFPLLLEQELPSFNIRLHNVSSNALVYIPDLQDAAGKQVFFNVGHQSQSLDLPTQSGSHQTHQQRFITENKQERIHLIEKDERWADVMNEERKEKLQPNATVVWSGGRMCEDFFLITERGASSIQARILIGPKQWISSKVIPVTIVPGNLESFPVVFKFDYVQGRATNMMWLVQGPVVGKEYIFDMETIVSARFRLRRNLILNITPHHLS